MLAVTRLVVEPALLDLQKQRLVADLEDLGGLLAVPVGLVCKWHGRAAVALEKDGNIVQDISRANKDTKYLEKLNLAATEADKQERGESFLGWHPTGSFG